MESFQSLKRVFGYGPKQSTRETRAVSPPSLTLTQLEKLRDERDAELDRIRAEQEEMNQASMIREASIFAHNAEVSMIISSLNEYLSSFFGEGVNVDTDAPNIRYFVGKIVTSKNVGLSVAQRLARSKPLLRAVANFIVNRATAGARGFHNQVTTLLPIIQNGLVNVGKFLLRLGVASGRAAYGAMHSAASGAASGARNYFSGEHVIQNQRAISPPRGMQIMRETASRAYESITTGLPLFYNALSDVLRHVYRLLAPCAATAASMAAAGAMSAFGALCGYFTPRQAVNQAVNQIDDEDYECSICMTDARDPTHAVLTSCNHRFHTSCITPWLTRNTTCPNCRQLAIPTRSAQAGGGLKKYRSRPNSKTRRLRKSRSKPRKSYKSRKPRSSSRRR